MPTQNSWGNQVLTDNVTFNGGTFSAGTDATSGAINIGTGAAARTITIGNDTGDTSVVVNCGTGALSLGANAIARATTLGNITGASSLDLKYGTGDFTLASATGTVMSALDTGEITYPLQPAFSAIKSANSLNVIGNNTQYTVICDTEKFDNNADYNNGNGIFTAPVDGKYLFCSSVTVTGCTVANTIKSWFINSSGVYNFQELQRTASNYMFQISNAALLILDAGDTCYFRINVTGEAAATADVGGSADGVTTFSGQLVC
jgi:hypothetical protein